MSSPAVSARPPTPWPAPPGARGRDALGPVSEVGRALTLGPGVQPADALGLAPGEPANVVVRDGLVLIDVAIGGICATELVGPGDLFQLGPSDGELLPCEWRVLVPEQARVVVLDGSLPAALRRWPTVGERLVDAAALHARRQLRHRAACQMPRVEDRVMAVLWLLAVRWGALGEDGVELPFALTHDLIGLLVGARRPTVTVAIGLLVDRGTLSRPGSGRLALRPGSRTELAPRATGGPRGSRTTDALTAGRPAA